MDSGKDIREAVIKYSDTLYRVCIVILCNEQDVQDAIQDTFCRYIEKRPEFRDEEHEKAWLIRVATNICRDMIRFRIRHPKIPIDEVENILVAPEQKETLKELLELPEGTLCYIRSTGVMSCAIEQNGVVTEEEKAAYKAEKERLEKTVQDAGGISGDEAVEIAWKQLEA